MMELHCTLWQNVAEIESCSQGWWNKECQHLLRTCKQNSWNTVSDWVINLPDTICSKYREDFKKLYVYFHFKGLKNYSIISWGFCFTTYLHSFEREREREMVYSLLPQDWSWEILFSIDKIRNSKTMPQQ